MAPKFYFQEVSQAFSYLAVAGQGDEQWIPPMDVYETESDYVVRLEIPGVRKQDLRLGFRDNTLTVCGKRNSKDRETKVTYLRMEIEDGEFRREIPFPERIHRDAVQAHYQEGILKVVLPKQ